ncbi:MAG: hypothetical protein ACJ79S_10140 [Gemmatimonadaceae bacterium]
MPFDRAHPLPSSTLQNIKATGVGQASLGRLWAAVWIGACGVIALPRMGAWWLVFWPAALGAFGLYGVAAKERQRLDIVHHPSLRRRAWLRVASGAALGVMVACALAGAVVVLGMLVGVDRLLDLLVE